MPAVNIRTEDSWGFEKYHPAPQAALKTREITENIPLSKDVNCISFRLTAYKANTRLIYSKESRTSVVIDPAGDGDKVLSLIRELNLKITQIWLTHSHPDHCGGVWQIKKETGAELLGSPHPKEVYMRKNVTAFNKKLKIDDPTMNDCPPLDRPLTMKSTLSVGHLYFQAIKTPGHSPGHFVFYSKQAKVLICGDLIFGKKFAPTDINGAKPKVFKRTLLNLKSNIPRNVLCLAGHGKSFYMADWDLPK